MTARGRHGSTGLSTTGAFVFARETETVNLLVRSGQSLELMHAEPVVVASPCSLSDLRNAVFQRLVLLHSFVLALADGQALIVVVEGTRLHLRSQDVLVFMAQVWSARNIVQWPSSTVEERSSAVLDARAFDELEELKWIHSLSKHQSQASLQLLTERASLFWQNDKQWRQLSVFCGLRAVAIVCRICGRNGRVCSRACGAVDSRSL